MPSVLSEQEYNQVYRILSDHIANIDDVIQSIKHSALPKLQQCESFLDIGPGTGFITNAISPHFQTCSVIEPSEEFCQQFRNHGYDAQAAIFQTAELQRQYDYVLCSHVLYNVELSEWPAFLDKMIAGIKPGGVGTIVLGAARGAHHEMCKSLQLAHKTTAPIIQYLNDHQIDYTIEETVSQYHAADFDSMHTLCRFSFLEDCFTAEQFANLSADERRHLDDGIKSYAEGLVQSDGRYRLDAEVDYIHIVKCI